MPEFDVETTITVDFEVFCSCGAAMCGSSRVSRQRGYNQLVVEPCENCMERARQDGRDEPREET